MENGKSRVLFVSGSIGLGHVWRDIAIARAIRKQNPDVEIEWLADPSSGKVLKDIGEKFVPNVEMPRYGNDLIESEADGYSLNLTSWYIKDMKGFGQNYEIFKEALAKENFDLVVGDEFYDIVTEIGRDKGYKGPPMVAIWDFLGFDAVSMSPKERLFVRIMNKSWTKPNPRFNIKKLIMIGELEDVPDKPLGLGLPSRRSYTKSNFECVGYVFPFDPNNFLDKRRARQELGYGEEPLIIASAGGTAIGRPLLDLCCSSYPLMKKKIPNLRMVVVAGPRMNPESIKKADGVEVRGYVPELYKHFAASDFSISMGGGTTTLELTALRIPFAFFPLEKHFEQELLIADRCKRIGAGINMKFSKTTPEMLADVATQNIGKKVTYPPIRTDGAENAGKVINGVLAGSSSGNIWG
jgi:UDP-N-acetylglucosamine:LPS N-acetylglucosamine transferase